MNTAEAKLLLDKYEQGTASADEVKLIENWYAAISREQNLDAAEADFWQMKALIWADTLKNTGLDEEPKVKVQRLWPRIAAAAAILLVAGAGLFFYTSYYAPRHPDLSRLLDPFRHLDDRRDLLNYANDIAPGKNTATITLADGSTIVLSDAKTGVVVGAESLTYNDGSAVGTGDARHLDSSHYLAPSHYLDSSRHLDDRRDPLSVLFKRSLPYGRDDVRGVDGGGSRNNARGGLLTAATPCGGTYQITLPDGTKVWLNAASSLKFPASFGSLKTRSVELTGEGYFEVAKDKAHPFIVVTEKQEVEVLGTHFNINSYADEASTKTTLLEGSVRVVYALRHPDPTHPDPSRHLEGSAATRDLLNSTGKRSLPAVRDDGGGRDEGKGQYDGARQDAITLKPNQQAVLTANNQIKVVKVDPEQAIAWKSGLFIFDAENLESIMKRVSRWYNVEIEYEDPKLKMQVFSGSVSRFEKISSLLSKLENTAPVKFKIEGKKVIVFR
jgi:ferric-dicitrate binding protein FerR (iron transport regulator)